MKYQGIRLSKGKMPGTVNLELAFLKRMYNIAELQDKFQGKNPVMKVKFLYQENIPDRILTLKEERRLLQAAPEHIANIIVCALNTGMRRGEMLSLKWDKVNLDHKYITLESTLTKAKKTRRVPINSILRDLLIELESKKQSDYVFTNEHGGEYLINSLGYLFRKSLKRAGIKGFRFHDLRHTAATRMVEAGVPLFTVGQILGHSNPKTTMRYAHPDQSLKDGLEALASYNRGNHSDTKSLYKTDKEYN
ncbi:MAG: site-specific integrase [Candidatus Dadabacteria bacterium]|nr:site-specific integrase [Candidatus Dadabacteria bacterium]